MKNKPETMRLPTGVRVCRLESRAQGDSEGGDKQGDGSIEIAISSEFPVEEFFGTETLDHGAEAVILDRFDDGGLPFRVVDKLDGTHYDGEQIGIVEKPTLGKDRVLRGEVRFSQSARAQEIRQDMLDGIRPYVSVGFRRLEMVLERETEETQDYRTTKWQPLEVTSVGVPADPKVGVGRAGGSTYPVQVIREPAHRGRSSEGDRSMKQEETGAPASGATGTSGAAAAVGAEGTGGGEKKIEARAANPDAVNIIKLARDFDRLDDGLAAVERGDSLATFVDTLRGQQAKPRVIAQPAAEEPKPSLPDLSKKEAKRYSFARAIEDGCEQRAPTGLEGEVHDALVQIHGEPRHGGMYLLSRTTPGFNTGPAASGLAIVNGQVVKTGERTILETGTATLGQELVFTEAGNFIDLLRIRAMVLQLGATFLPGLVGNIAFPRQTAAASGSWVAETPGSDVAESNLTLDQVTLSPKTYQASSHYSRQLIRQALGSVNLEQLVRRDMATAHALALDDVALEGGGTSEPEGVTQATGVNLVAIGTNGGAVAWSHVVEMESEIAADNADMATMKYLFTPEIRGKMKTTPKESGQATYIWESGPEPLNGYPAFVSNNLPKDLTKGTLSGTGHAAVFGVWETMLIGEWGALEFIVDPFILKKQGVVEITSFQMTDVQFRHVEHFCKIVDIDPAA